MKLRKPIFEAQINKLAEALEILSIVDINRTHAETLFAVQRFR